MKETSVKRVLLFSVSIAFLLFVTSRAGSAAESRPTWQVEWEKTLKAAEAEGEVTVYVVDYPRLTVSQFQKAYPKIKLNLVDGPSGPALSSRLMAERRAGKYQADLYIGGQGITCFSFVSRKGSGADASGFYPAGGERRVEMVQRQASFCRSGNSSLFRLSGTSRPLHLHQHPASEGGRDQIVVGSYKPKVERKNYRLRPYHCRGCPQCSLVPLYE